MVMLPEIAGTARRRPWARCPMVGSVDRAPWRARDRCYGAPPSRRRPTCIFAVLAPVSLRSHRPSRPAARRTRQIAWLGRPVVHLGVDVDRVLARPGRAHALVPDALQIGRLPAGPRTADEQVTAELEIERRELRIGAGGEILDPLVGRPIGGFRLAQVQRDVGRKSR